MTEAYFRPISGPNRARVSITHAYRYFRGRGGPWGLLDGQNSAPCQSSHWMKGN